MKPPRLEWTGAAILLLAGRFARKVIKVTLTSPPLIVSVIESTVSGDASMPAMMSMGPMELVLVAMMLAFMVGAYLWPTWIICKRAGLPPSLALLAILPFGIVIVLFILALSAWPALSRESDDVD